MPARIVEFFRRPWRGVVALALLALAPKCVVCLAGYVGLGALLGLGGPELCGVAAGPALPAAPIIFAGLLAGLILGLALRKHAHDKNPG